MADPEFFKKDGAVIAESTKELEAIEAELTTLFARWEELEG